MDLKNLPDDINFMLLQAVAESSSGPSLVALASVSRRFNNIFNTHKDLLLKTLLRSITGNEDYSYALSLARKEVGAEPASAIPIKALKTHPTILRLAHSIYFLRIINIRRDGALAEDIDAIYIFDTDRIHTPVVVPADIISATYAYAAEGIAGEQSGARAEFATFLGHIASMLLRHVSSRTHEVWADFGSFVERLQKNESGEWRAVVKLLGTDDGWVERVFEVLGREGMDVALGTGGVCAEWYRWIHEEEMERFMSAVSDGFVYPL